MMRFIGRVLGTCGFALAVLASGCGGGGGGSGTPVGNTGASSSSNTSGGSAVGTNASPVSVTLLVNGVIATPDAAGVVSIAPGDTIAITASQASNWSTTASDSSAISLAKTATTAQSWAAQFINGTSSAVTYTVTATSLTGSGNAKAVAFKIAAADGRNGVYKVFATNGSIQSLTINFDTKTLVMTDSQNAVTTATLVASSSEAGTYDIVSPLNPNVFNTARLRVAADRNNIVGSFPFAVQFASPARYSVQAFVASKALVTQQSQLDGIYNRLGIEYTATGSDSQIRQVRVRAGGTVFETCVNTLVVSITTCSSYNTYTVTANPESGSWHIVNNADLTDIGNFHMAVIGGQNVYLSAGSPVANGTQVFRIGPQDISSWASVTARGADTLGTWGVATVTSNAFLSTGVDTTGIAFALNFDLTAIGLNGLRSAVSRENSSNRFFVAQGAKIGAVVGARTNVATQGYIQIGLLD